ncbi:DVU0772 family protein [Desulforamulus aeronauticus]|uniref:Uncharacterized protein n=1 Tax=Desulforamulus aeronauticus DSM 10349 TaxID=1121421 RepID=A0A1M6NDH2_9FIRM|nr:hypothetical protein [Desulforamulus aeronauticus]SHJ93659.1 hypothetical protein SAMN02745123_00067 [Desulforamulus aeronauticus DSM 10349]
MATPIIKALIDWDYDLQNEFKNRSRGYTFVVDAWETPKLALYKFTPFGVKCDYLEQQPPQELLLESLQGQEKNPENIYKINQAIRTWIEENIHFE